VIQTHRYEVPWLHATGFQHSHELARRSVQLAVRHLTEVGDERDLRWAILDLLHKRMNQ
jgi:hypothetical protein